MVSLTFDFIPDTVIMYKGRNTNRLRRAHSSWLWLPRPLFLKKQNKTKQLAHRDVRAADVLCLGGPLLPVLQQRQEEQLSSETLLETEEG